MIQKTNSSATASNISSVLSQKLNNPSLLKQQITAPYLNSTTAKEFAPLIQSSKMGYEKARGTSMDPMRQAILTNSIEQLVLRMVRSGKVSRQQIQSAAVEEIWEIDSPITMLFNLLSVVVPNFTFMEAVGTQPMPTKISPIIYPQLTANNTRNGITAQDLLLGTTGWNANNTYTGNKVKGSAQSAASGNTAISLTLPTGKDGNPIPFLAGQTQVTAVGPAADGSQSFIATDAGATGATGNLVRTDTGAPVGTITYASGAISMTAAGATGWTYYASARYDLNLQDPAQVVFEFSSQDIEAQPHRIRSTYDLDNFYAAAKTLTGQNFDLDKVLATTMAGYINKEISNEVFDEMLDNALLTDSWTAPVANGSNDWYWANVSVLDMVVEASSKIRKGTARSGGNVIIAGQKLMNTFKKIGGSVATVPNASMWQPQSYSAEPIGPYVAGTFNGEFKVIYNQDYDENMSVMAYKKDDMDASVQTGIFLGLYATEPLGLDSLSVVQGMGTQLGTKVIFPTGLRRLIVS